LSIGLLRRGRVARAAIAAVMLGLLAPAFVVAQTTTSAQLDGAGSFGIPSLPAMGGSVTLEGWVRPRSFPSWARLVELGNGRDNNNILIAPSSLTTGKPNLTFYTGGSLTFSLDAPNAIPLNAWTHLAGVINADRSCQLYVNGQLVASGTASALPASVARTSNFIGKSNWSSDALMDGSVADVRIWSVARSQAEIQASMPVGSIKGATTGLVAAYPFGATGAAALADVSGNNLALTQAGTVQFNVGGPTSPITTSANNVISAGLNGSGSYTIASLPALDGALTFETWVRPAGHGSYARILDLGPNTSDNLLLCTTVGTTGRALFVVNRGGTTALWSEAPSTLSIGRWTHVAAVLGSDRSARLYIDGQLVASGTSSSLGVSTASTSNFIGKSRYWQDPLFNGAVTDVRIWSTARTQAEIQANMPVGSIAGATTGLVAAYPFGSTGASALADVSGNSRTLTQSANVEYAKLGAGSVTTQGLQGTSSLNVSAGSLTFSSAQTYTGGTVINGGTLRLAADGNQVGIIRGSVTVASQGQLLLAGMNALGWETGTKVESITINGGLVEATTSGDQGWGVAYQLNGGELRSNGGVSSTGATSYYSMGGGATVTTLANPNPALITGRIILRDGNPNDVLPFTVADGSAAIDLLVSASITPQSTTGSLTKSGAGTMVLSGQNTYAGVTTISAGTLQVGNAGTTGTLGTGNVVNNASLVFNRSDAMTLNNAISGTGTLAQAGAGTLTLSGNNTYTGNTTVSAGTLALTGSGSIGNSPTITLASAAAFDASGRSSTFALGAAQTMANSGGTALLGGNMNATAGTLSMACDGSNPAFSVSGGTLTLSANTVVRVSKSGSALAHGTYKLVAKGTGGSVAGSVSSAVTVSGSGVVANAGAFLEITNGELLLRVVPPATIALGNLSQAYDGNAHPVSATTTPSGLAVRVTYNGSTSLPVNAGSYAVVATIADPAYYGTANGTLVVAKASAGIFLANLSQAYDGTARKVVAITQPSGLSWSATYGGGANAPTNIGIYAVVATVSDPNYSGFTNAVLTVKAGNPGSRPASTPQPPAYLNHHGYLTDAAGSPLGTPNPRNHDVIFRIFTSPSGGSSLWTERQVVTVDQGEYDVMLGEGMSHGVEPWPALDTVLAMGSGTTRYLEVTVRGIGVGGSDVVLRPRFLLPSQPYAFLSRHARTAETLLGSNNLPVLRVSGNAIGIGVERANATLDVGGVLTATSLASDGNATVSGKYFATAFEGAGTIPLGGIVVWTGSSPPQGWALCNGQTANGRRTPDLRSRFVLGQGQGSGLTARSVGQVGGQEAYVLTYNNLAPHRHVFDPPGTWTHADGGHSHGYQTHSIGNPNQLSVQENYIAGEEKIARHLSTSRNIGHDSHQHSVSVSSNSGSSGGGQAHNAMPPFYTLAYIMRVQ
jgi:autotransporter-associated beta strand protein